MKRQKNRELSSKWNKGQITLGTLVIGVPMFFMALIIVVDFGRLIVLHNQAKIYADGAALAAAGAVNINEFTASRNTVLDPAWASTRAYDHFNMAIEHYQDQDSWMRLSITNVSIMGNKAYVTVDGRCDGLLVKAFGVNEWHTMVTAEARASAGVSIDIAP